MNDRYLYRAKRTDNGEWVQGYLYGIWERRYILWGMTNDVPDMIEVDPTTICQCTGSKDKNGKLIWEHDIIEIDDDIKDYFNITGGAVHYIGGNYVIGDGDGILNSLHYISNAYHVIGGKVIGNIFDNPELLEEV